MHNFIFEPTKIPEVIVVTPKVFGDSRGYFTETYQKEVYSENGIKCDFVQDNESKSTKGVLRGLHFQKQHTQAKLVRILQGEVFDVAVDCRPNSPTFGQWVGEVLSAENRKQLFVPQGFAHGFLVLSDEAVFAYKCSDYYDNTSEGGIVYNDEAININWPKLENCEIQLSEKDAKLPGFKGQDFAFFERW